jgi:hypothetical protein
MALGVVTANALVMGAGGAVAPMAWLFVPVMVSVLCRPGSAALVSLWGSALIGLSVVLPVIPGHDADPWALGASLVSLALLPGMAWVRVRVRGPVRPVAYARRGGPGVTTLTAGSGARRAALARSGLPSEVAAAVQLPGTGVRILIGVIAGQVPCPASLRDHLEKSFCDLAIQDSWDLARTATELGRQVARSAPQGYVAATLVEIDCDGAARLLYCGSPHALAMPAHGGPSGEDGLRVVSGDGGGPPLGLGQDRMGRIEPLSDTCRVAVVTNAFALAHYDDFASAVAESLHPASSEHAAVLLLRGPTELGPQSSGVELAPVVGPALVIDPRQ